MNLPQVIIDALKEGKISEGHTRPLLMLIDRPEEQMVLFKEIMIRKMNVREAELSARRIALERARHTGTMLDLETREIEDKLTETLGTRVMIEKRHQSDGGRVTIAFFSDEDLKTLLNKLKGDGTLKSDKIISSVEMEIKPEVSVMGDVVVPEEVQMQYESDPITILDDRSKEEIEKADNTDSDEELYSIKNFSI
jgi:HTH domain found in ParB protein